MKVTDTTLFLYGPLLLGSHLADRWLWRRAR